MLSFIQQITHPIITDGLDWCTDEPIKENTTSIGLGPYCLLLKKQMFQTPVTIIIPDKWEREKKIKIENPTARQIFTAIQREMAGRHFSFRGLQQIWPNQYLVKLGPEIILANLHWPIGMDVSMATELSKPAKPANLDCIIFDNPVKIWFKGKLILADNRTTLGEILSKIKAVYNESKSDKLLFFEGLAREGLNEYSVQWGD